MLYCMFYVSFDILIQLVFSIILVYISGKCEYVSGILHLVSGCFIVYGSAVPFFGCVHFRFACMRVHFYVGVFMCMYVSVWLVLCLCPCCVRAFVSVWKLQVNGALGMFFFLNKLFFCVFQFISH